MRRVGPVLRDAWMLFKPYFFQSEERWSALGLLGVVLLMSFAQVGIGVVVTYWQAEFFNAITAKQWAPFINLLFTYEPLKSGWLMPGLVWLVLVLVLISVYSTWLQQLLQIRWRRWMTTTLLRQWLSDRAFYRISLTSDPQELGMDNPDQRITDDLVNFTGGGSSPSTDTLSLGIDLISNVVSLFSYVGVLWVLPGPITLLGVTIHGYMVWVALLYAIFGSWVTHMVGRVLVPLRFWQQRLEADLRFGLVRVRENMEAIALQGGEASEQVGLNHSLGLIVGNFRALMNRIKLLNGVLVTYGQIGGIFPTVVAAPRYFAGAFPFGVLNQIGVVFGQVQSSFSWFATNYSSLATWRATVTRLAAFQRAIDAARLGERAPALAQRPAAGDAFQLDHLTLALPDGAPLIQDAALRLRAGEWTVISGPSGSGKSSLFRALAGIWPFAAGEARRPAGRAMFLPQRPYVPLGTLRHALAYPAAPGAYPDELMRQVLEDVGLGAMVDLLDVDANWSQRLSGGEQQRLAIGRALLGRPDWLFLDEATASLDPAAEAAIYASLRERLPRTTVVSIAHHANVGALHDRRIRFERHPGAPGRLVEEQPVPAG